MLTSMGQNKIMWSVVALWLVSYSNAAGRPVIVSTDPGIDDSIALLLAVASPELDLRAVCIDFGSLDNSTQMAHNALSVLALAGAPHIPVYVGAASPISAAYHDLGGTLFHGKDGLGGVHPPASPSHGVNRTLSAPEAIVEACRSWNPKPVLVSLSPLANIAIALELEPNLPSLCPDLYLMGGTVAAPGNVSPLAEANIANDPEAAQKVLSAGFVTRIAGLDVTMSIWLNQSYLDSFKGLHTRSGDFVYSITQFYTNAYRVHAGYDGGMPLHDPTAVMLLLEPSAFETVNWDAVIDTAAYPASTRGVVMADRRGGPLTPHSNSSLFFAMNVDAEAIRSELYSRISNLH